ncbi:MAG: porin [Myxococcota bacterium]
MTDRMNRAILTLTACAALVLAASPALAQSGEDAEASTDDSDAAAEAAEDVEAGARATAESSDDDAEDAEGADDEAPSEDADQPEAEPQSGEERADESAEPVEGTGIEPETEDMDVEKPVVEREVETRVAVDVNPEPTVFIAGNAEAEQDDNVPFPGWRIGLTGYIRTQYTAIEDDPGTNFGRNDGFALADARLGVVGESKDGIGFKLQIDAGTARPTGDANDPVGEVVTRLTDGYIYYAPHTLLRVSAGQFKPPFDLEELISTSSILFIERSVGSRGVRNIEGPNREGLSRTREVGLRVDSAPYYFTADDPEDPEGLGVSYGLAVTNGQTVNRTLNDNDQLAYTGRATIHWGEHVQVGGGAYQNDKTLGTPPDQIGESRFGWTADVLAQAYGAVLFASVVQTDIEPAAELTNQEARTARAFQAQVGYRDPVIGIGPTYRFAHYDGDIDADGASSPRQYEALTYHTVGIIADPWDYPIRFLANYTITNEEVNPVQNNRFDALIQLAW